MWVLWTGAPSSTTRVRPSIVCGAAVQTLWTTILARPRCIGWLSTRASASTCCTRSPRGPFKRHLAQRGRHRFADPMLTSHLGRCSERAGRRDHERDRRYGEPRCHIRVAVTYNASRPGRCVELENVSMNEPYFQDHHLATRRGPCSGPRQRRAPGSLRAASRPLRTRS